jgi:predicted RNA-binding Zn-ribbon protein involved in translation (DUF1610 family)
MAILHPPPPRPPASVADQAPPPGGSMMVTRMTRFPPPQRITRTIILCEILPALRGVGEVDYLCGFCGAAIVEAVDRGQLQQLAFKCPSCVRYSELPVEEAPVGDVTDCTSDGLVLPVGVLRTTATIKVPRTPFTLFGERSE